MNKITKIALAVSASSLFVACGGGGTSSNSSSSSNSSQKDDVYGNNDPITISSDVEVERLSRGTRVQKTIHLGSSRKNLYILLSNSNPNDESHPSVSHNAKIVSKSEKKIAKSNITIKSKIKHASESITRYRAKLIKNDANKNEKIANIVKYKKTTAGDSHRFYIDEQGNQYIDATAKKIVSDVYTTYGYKTLNVWVADDSFSDGWSGCAKKKCVTQSMVDELADKFLKDGSDNDIYDWDTNIFGEEWGSDASEKYSNVITESNEINILLMDIDGDNEPEGGAVGYFYSKDNIKQSYLAGSNEMIMFYIDSVMFANRSSDTDWTKEVYATLAHEFVHMIEYYQKSIKKELQHDTWIVEMLAETTEDMVATKIEHTGPRGVDPSDGSAGASDNQKGRYPLFNYANDISLTTWNNSITNYSLVSSFGAFLNRNYGGARVLDDIMHSSNEHTDSIMYAVNLTAQGEDKKFSDLLREWGVAVILSDQENLENMPTYNTGDFTQNEYRKSTYELGSVNFYNYTLRNKDTGEVIQRGPKFFTNEDYVNREGNYYYKIGENLTGDINIDITTDDYTEATLIAK